MRRDEGTSTGEGAGRLAVGIGGLQDIVQLSLKPQPIRPGPKVVAIKLEMRVFDNTDHIVKVCWPTGLQFQEYQIFWADDREREPVQVHSLCPCQRLPFMRVGCIDEIQRVAGMRPRDKASDSILGHRIGCLPRRIDGDIQHSQSGNQPLSRFLVDKDQQIEIMRGARATPGTERCGPNQTVRNR